MDMLYIVLTLLVGVVLAAVVVGLVAIPAHRDGRSVLTARGGRVFGGFIRRSDRATGPADGPRARPVGQTESVA